LAARSCDKSNDSRFARPPSEDEGIWLDHVDVHLVTHPVGQVKPMHTHDPPQDHVIVMRSGRMRWAVEDQTHEPEGSDVSSPPRGQRVVCIDSPALPKPES
jgi:hypothetical protein